PTPHSPSRASALPQGPLRFPSYRRGCSLIVTDITVSQSLHQISPRAKCRRGGFHMPALSARPFVDYFQPEQLKRLSSLMTPKRVQSGTNLFQDKEQADYLYFIHEIGRASCRETG